MLIGKEEFGDINAEYESVTPTIVRRELQKCGAGSIPIIIIDEYNEIIDQDAKVLTANLIKEFYDFSVSTTIILVGVADNITDLIGNHPSAVRAIIETPLARMSEHELKEIIQKRVSRTVMTFSGDAIWTIITLSRGLPYFTQTLSKHAAIQAIDDQRLSLTYDDVENSMTRFIQDSETIDLLRK